MKRIGILFFLFSLAAGPVFAQVPGLRSSAPAPAGPQTYEILGITVEGAETDESRQFVQQTSGLQVGQQVLLPGDPAFGEGIRKLYNLGTYSDIEISVEKIVGTGAFLVIRVKEEPRLGDYRFRGIKKGQQEDLRKKAPLLRGRPVRPGDIERTRQVVRDYYAEKGYPLTEVAVERVPAADGRVDLVFDVDRGERVEVGRIIIEGNEEISDRRIKRKMKEINEKRWWRFWSKETFDEQKLAQDLQSVIEYYNEKGYYDAHIVNDTTWVEREGDPSVVVRFRIEEGPQYHIRNVTWEGNTQYTDEQLNLALGFNPGDVYNRTKLERNLYGNPQSSDVASLYMNLGYMRFNATPEIQVAPGDSLDISFDVYEGDIYEFGDINIAGNNRTKEHVIRRSLRTIPGQTFSRDAIQRSIRELAALNFFNQEKLGAGPQVDINDQEKRVDLTYSLEETSGDSQIELSGGWGGRGYGLMLITRLSFNNFSMPGFFDKSAWRPLPMGDGQKLSLAVQVQGKYYQNYSVSFEEPWYGGRPTPLGFSLSHSRIDYGKLYYYQSLAGGDDSEDPLRLFTTAASLYYGRQLKWPDDYFQSSSALGYRLYNTNRAYGILPEGINQSVTLKQTLTRNSTDNPLFPLSGSEQVLSLEVAPPVPGFIQYHKWRLFSSWNVPVKGKLSFGVSADFGYLGSFRDDPVRFERYLVGGTPLDAGGGYFNYGYDYIFMRGYPFRSVGPRTGDVPIGGTVLNKYASELRLVAIQSPQFTLVPYLFFDAANTWNGFGDYNPARLYRSTGVGARILLPILGMVDLTYGRNLDPFNPLDNGETGLPDWRFQFSLGAPLR